MIVRLNLILLLLTLVTISCKTAEMLKSTNNPGKYAISFYKSPKLAINGDVIVYGYVKDLKNKLPLGSSKIELGCFTAKADTNGHYRFTLKSGAIQTFLSASSIGYKSVETEFFHLAQGDSIRINFYLSLDERPLINCEGIRR